MRWLNWSIRKKNRYPIGRIAFNMYPTRGPWGGSSLFVRQLTEYLKWRGYEPIFCLKKDVDIIIIIDPRKDLQKKSFDLDDIINYRKENPHCKIIHRINECDQRKMTNFMDDLLAEANKVADYTVFISQWLKDYHAKKWFDCKRPHRVIYNGADPRIFHPIGNRLYQEGETFRLVTHHWSDNPMKGFSIYQELDDLIHKKIIKDIELWIIGRWPNNIIWKVAKTFPPTADRDLANKLRACHAYLTASFWEPCGMHHIEGAQCGLPLIYHYDGGGINEAGKKYGVGFRDNLVEAIMEMKREYNKYRKLVFQHMPSGDRMCLDYIDIINELMVTKS